MKEEYEKKTIKENWNDLLVTSLTGSWITNWSHKGSIYGIRRKVLSDYIIIYEVAPERESQKDNVSVVAMIMILFFLPIFLFFWNIILWYWVNESEWSNKRKKWKWKKKKNKNS